MKGEKEAATTPLYWKNRMWKLYQRYAHIGEVESFEPELAKKLRESPDFYFDGTYNYQLKEDGFVVRIHHTLARAPNTIKEPPRTTHHHKKEMNQK